MQIDWFAKTQLSYDASALQIEAQEMYDRIFHMKFLPPGRGLWAMGTPLTKERKLFAALNNCAFVSTADLAKDPSKPFCFLMDASMLGVGVGFDTRGAGSVIVRSVSSSPSAASGVPVHVVEDSREGWVESLRILLTAYLDPDIPQYSNRTNANSNVMPQFDYSQIRSAGALIKGFGGVSQGPQILKDLHQSISQLLETRANQPISVTSIVDIMNLIGKCVVSGNIRRTAEIAFGDPESEEYISLKDYTVNPERASYGWTSNNSVFATLGMNYSRICENVRANGEPGFAWLENMQAYGRMSEPKNFRDYRARGGNPCLEQTLESFELCCLVEVFPMKHDTEEDFLRSVQLAMTYAKTVTLGSTHWPESNAVMLRNRRIGTSLSGIAQFIAAKGMGVLKDWCEAGYETVQQQDRLLSERFAIPRSVKTTCIKPSGTVSLLAGSTPGMHYPESRYYMRRIRMAKSSDQIPILSAAGYHIEPAEGDVERTVVVSIPVDVGEGVRTLDDVTMWEQLALAAFLQAHWADNQVSCTVTFDPMTEASQLSQALDLYQYQLKGVSFLPRLQLGAYPQMPYESITKDEYEEQYARLKPLNISTGKVMAGHDEVPDKFCDAAGCAIETTERVKEL
eukprot:CAMPEP_0182436698 /NCGR_PEP_ID=MMETSP1167-20130531/83062_1 /TAXON_ID=2988 /ORGANISM="Mallomonas Sp, Strain CCMP3275" /LENGTH=624 /DNA_ID=CAMNT_0024629141 /DNA_START=341 /DNA_END=2215 /DNA_ORIENTATION=-